MHSTFMNAVVEVHVVGWTQHRKTHHAVPPVRFAINDEIAVTRLAHVRDVRQNVEDDGIEKVEPCRCGAKRDVMRRDRALKESATAGRSFCNESIACGEDWVLVSFSGCGAVGYRTIVLTSSPTGRKPGILPNRPWCQPRQMSCRPFCG